MCSPATILSIFFCGRHDKLGETSTCLLLLEGSADTAVCWDDIALLSAGYPAVRWEDTTVGGMGAAVTERPPLLPLPWGHWLLGRTLKASAVSS